MIAFVFRRPTPLGLGLAAIICVAVALFLLWNLQEPAPELEAPQNLTASMGTSKHHVEISWAVVEEATEYLVYRDGEFLATVDTTTFIDEGADPGEPAKAPELTASTNHLHGVMLQWSEPSVPMGRTHIYQVRALDAERESELSLAAMGYRGAQPIVGYELKVRRGDWLSLGLERSFFDESAEEMRRNRLVSASQGENEDYVHLEFDDSFTLYGPASEYKVRAVTAGGFGTSSERIVGRRSITHPTPLQWQRSVSLENQDFVDIPGAKTAQFRDTDVDPGHIYYYRILIGAQDDVQGIVSEATPGFRSTQENAIAATSELEAKQLCELSLDTRQCWCMSDNDQKVHLCGDGVGYWTNNDHSPALLVFSLGAQQWALPIAEYASYEDGDSHGAETRRLSGFEIVEARAGLLHVELTSSHHSFESMGPVLFDHRSDTTISAIIDLEASTPRLLALIDQRYRERRIGGEEFEELKNDARWPENLRDDYEAVPDLERNIRIDDDGEALLIDAERFDLRGALIRFPFRGARDGHLKAAFMVLGSHK